MLSDPLFLQLLSIFGVNASQPGQVYPRVDSSVQKESFASMLKLMYASLEQLAPSEGPISKDQIEAVQVI